VLKIANEVEKRLTKVQTPIQVAVMGCLVNGPGESRDADVGLSGGRGKGAISCQTMRICLPDCARPPAARLIKFWIAHLARYRPASAHHPHLVHDDLALRLATVRSKTDGPV
jgi:hypothetical protein